MFSLTCCCLSISNQFPRHIHFVTRNITVYFACEQGTRSVIAYCHWSDGLNVASIRFHVSLHIVSPTVPDPKLGVTVGPGCSFAAHNPGEIGCPFSIEFRTVSSFLRTGASRLRYAHYLKYCTMTARLRCRKKDSLSKC